MKAAIKIVGVGSPIVDSIAQIDDAFLQTVEGEKGGMVLVEDATIKQIIERIPGAITRSPGGSAGNTLFALARLGAPAAFLGKTGDCANGQFYRARFAELGGDSSRFKIGSSPNGHCLSLVTPDGERTMRTDLGAAMTLQPDEIHPDDFAGCQHAHIEGYLLFNEALLRAVLAAAKEAGCTISLDLASFEVVQAAGDTLREILRDSVDIVFANEEEAAAFTGLSDDYPAMARTLAELCSIAAVKIGAEGAWIASGDQLFHAASVPAASVIDTTGAGDLWAAGFLYGWSRQRPLADCARYGALLGSAVVQQQGTELPEAVWQPLQKEIQS